MAIITSRTSENGRIRFIYDRCNSCGLCVKVCKDFSLRMEDNKPVEGDHPLFGCIACGQCMAICPNKAIEISGREISADDLVDFSELTNKTDFEQLIIQYGAKKLKQKWNIPPKTPSGIVVIFGYPKYKFKSGIKRSFADVSFFSN